MHNIQRLGSEVCLQTMNIAGYRQVYLDKIFHLLMMEISTHHIPLFPQLNPEYLVDCCSNSTIKKGVAYFLDTQANKRWGQ